MSKVELSRTLLHILTGLLRNPGSKSRKQIAHEIGVSEPVLSKGVQELIDYKQVVTREFVPDMVKFGFTSHLYFEIRVINHTQTEVVIDSLRSIAQVKQVFYMATSGHLRVICLCSSPDDSNDVTNKMLTMPGVEVLKKNYDLGSAFVRSDAEILLAHLSGKKST